MDLWVRLKSHTHTYPGGGTQPSPGTRCSFPAGLTEEEIVHPVTVRLSRESNLGYFSCDASRLTSPPPVSGGEGPRRGGWRRRRRGTRLAGLQDAMTSSFIVDSDKTQNPTNPDRQPFGNVLRASLSPRPCLLHSLLALQFRRSWRGSLNLICVMLAPPCVGPV